MQLSVAEISTILGVQVQGVTTDLEQIFVQQADYDSRCVQPGSLFVAIKGEQVDGHDYVSQAMQAGARAILCERFLPELALPQLIVDNSVQALGKLAHAWRMSTQAKVIGVTGTAGKTTVKQALYRVLSLHGSTLVSPRNLNTQIGLPCSILAGSGQEAYWVLECGISHAGDMDALGQILTPDLALILNVGPGHTQGLGDLGVAHNKTRLLTHLAQGGQGVVSADYQDLVWKAVGCHLEHLTFFSAKSGVAGSNAYFAEHLGSVDATHDRYRLTLTDTSIDVTVPFKGDYGAENSIAVACVAHLLGVPNDLIKRGLEGLELPPQRFNSTKIGNWLVIDDSYNANPLSMERMLRAAATPTNFVVVLGEMRELGKESAALHKALGELLASLKPCAVFWKGEMADCVSQGYKGPITTLSTPAKFATDLDNVLGTKMKSQGGTVLFKGSRANALESFVPQFKAWLEGI